MDPTHLTLRDILRQEVPYDERWTVGVSSPTIEYVNRGLHVMVVSTDGEREAAWNDGIDSIQLGIFQSAARQHGLLGTVESDGTKLFPVAHKLILDNDFVDGDPAL